MVFEIWIRILINEVLWILYIYSSFIGEDIDFERVIFVQNITSWVKWKLALIYDQFSYNAYTRWMILFESLIVMVVAEFLWIILTNPFFISEHIILERFPWPKPHNLDQMHTSTYL